MIILRYILTFFLYSAGGWAVESTYRSIGEKKLLNSGFLTGPMCPIYGTAGLVMIVCLYNPFKERPLLVFLLGMIICDAVEYITSFLMELLFNQHWWNYEYEFCNINGRICLKHTLYWGIASVGFTYVIHPGVDKLISGLESKTVIILLCVIFAVFIVDVVHAFIKALDVRSLQTKFMKFTSKISVPFETIGGLINEQNEKFSGSREEVFEQVEKLIEAFEKKLSIQKGKVINRFYKNTYINKTAMRELELLKKIRDEIKATLSDSDKK